MKLKKDHDPFLSFFGYDQQRINEEHGSGEVAPWRPLATLVKYENGRPVELSQEIRKTLEKYHDVDINDDEVLDQLIDLFDPEKGWAAEERDSVETHNYKSQRYWRLPPNVRRALDIAHQRSKCN